MIAQLPRKWIAVCAVLFYGWLFQSVTLAAADALVGPRAIEIKQSPQRVRSIDPVEITIKTGFPTKSATLEYQVVEPGSYIALKDPAYKSGWIAIPMVQSESHNGFTAQIPPSVQIHRRLIRYRIKALDREDRAVLYPAADSPEPNSAYFVYDGVPPWKGAIDLRSQDPKRSAIVEFSPSVMSQVQNYFLIAKVKDIENATWYEQSQDKAYKYTGTFVCDGKVYDHVGFRARGGAWRHAMGKNMWKVDFNKGHLFQARDDYGQNYHAKWSKLNLRPCIQQGDYGARGEQGMYESVGFRLFNLVGVPAPRTHWVSWRIIDEAQETPSNQYRGDFWGLYLAIENEDGHFLSEHGLPDGNVYKMMFGSGELSYHGAKQPTNHTDLQQLKSAFHQNQPESWWRNNVDLPEYYSYRAIVEAIHHYDISDGKNYDFYFNPKKSKWNVIPWDIDLTWGDQMYGGGYEPFMRPVLSRPAFRLEYQNRLREIRDLLFNANETDRLIDECAALISNPRHLPSIVDADRAKWDYHPIMASRYVIPQKAGKGLFYQASETGDFPGMVRGMKRYARSREAYIDRQLINDPAIPGTPALTSTANPGKDLTFKSSPFAGAGQFAGMKWRLGEVDPPKPSPGKPTESGHYEITPVWESAELTAFKGEMTIPSNVITPGHTYRARVRMKDQTGRWSHWSAPIQFVASTEAK